jgi:hypothetical protein
VGQGGALRRPQGGLAGASTPMAIFYFVFMTLPH